MNDYLFSLFTEDSQFDIPESIGYPTLEWLSLTGILQYFPDSPEIFRVSFLNQTNADYIYNNTITDEINYFYIQDEFDTIQGVDSQIITVNPLIGWNTLSEMVTVKLEENIKTKSKIDTSRISVLSRGTNPVLYFNPTSTITAPTRFSTARELEYIANKGEWFVAIADIQNDSLSLHSTPSSIHWVSSTDILNSKKIEEYSDIKLDNLSVSTTTEYVKLEFEEVDINALDVLCSDLYLYQVVDDNKTIAFNCHFPESIVVEKIKPSLQLSWSIFENKYSENSDDRGTYLVI